MDLDGSEVRLAEAIERLYVVFAPYPASRVEGCPCCVSPGAQGKLHAKRLRDLEDEDLAGFAFSALNTWGSLRDLKHFLPRILELEARGELWTDLQIVYGKLVQEGPWTDEEVHALGAFTKELFVGALHPRARPGPRTILESAVVARMDATALLDHGFPVGVALAPARATALAALIDDHARGGGWIWAPEGAAILDGWLGSGWPRAALLATFEAHPAHPDAAAWAEAFDILDALTPA